MSEEREQKPTELLIRLDERFTSFEKTFPMMFDELMVKHREVLHEFEKKADMLYVAEIEKDIAKIAKDLKKDIAEIAQDLKDHKEDTDTKMRAYDKLIWKGAGALMAGGFIGGLVMTLLMNKLQDLL